MPMAGAAAHELAPGSEFAGHDILAKAGRGASAVVYLARHRSSGSARALKVLDSAAMPGHGLDAPGPQGSPALRHPDIIAVLDRGHEQGLPWQSMEWVPGHDLGRYTQPRLLLPEVLSLELAARLARALAHAHSQGVVHRDIKPANIRIHLAQQVIKIGDFDIAKEPDSMATMTGVLKGTPVYMAPELLAGAQPAAATDLYALGVVLHEMLTGHRPHEADSMGELLRKLATPPAPPSHRNPTLPASVDELFQRLLNPRPQARPHSGAQLADELLALGRQLRHGA